MDVRIRAKRQSIAVSTDELVDVALPPAGRTIPTILAPRLAGVNLAEWLMTRRSYVDELLLAHRALLFRGFRVHDVASLEAIVAASSSGARLEYRDRTSPRYAVGDNVYVSTIYPAAQAIHLHNEGTYWREWPLKIYFCCLHAPREGGATPIADVRAVFQRIPAEVRDPLVRRQVMYVRNYNDGLGLRWQEVFQAAVRHEVEATCRRNGITFEWKDGDRLRTTQVRPAVRWHPVTGEPVWFNHAAFFHISAYDPAVRDALLANFLVDELPYHTCYGDGEPIPESAIRVIREAYEAERVTVPWREGDVLLLDNMSVAHGRDPYVGERQVIVAMVEPVADTAA